MKKIVWTLNVDDYAPNITAITYPLIRYYANKIDAEFRIISERKFPSWPVTYEKLQIYELAQEAGADWNIYLDSDAIIHPETPDWTEIINKDTVFHHGYDVGLIRWKYDKYFRRDNRHIGSCNWCTIASYWCIDLWKPIDDMTLEETLTRIRPTVIESNGIIVPEHLIDDYALSRNIAKFGLKVGMLMAIIKDRMPFLKAYWHAYNVPEDKKVIQMIEVIKEWELFKYYD